MANRYWVGGTGTWGASTLFWSATSGGPSGASVPTAADDVFFDAGSDAGANFTVTLGSNRACRNLTAGSLDFVMTLAGGFALTVSGSLTFPATNFIRTYTGLTTFDATTAGNTITTNGVTFGSQVLFQGLGGWVLGSAFNSSATTIFLYAGTLDTAGFLVNATSVSSPTVNARTLTLGASTVTLSSGVDFTSSMVLNAGTSTINLTNPSSSLVGGDKTFYNVNFTSTAITTVTITGNNTYNNLSFAARAAAGIGKVNIASTINTINGTLTLGSGTTGVARLFVSSATSSGVFLSVASLATTSDVDFRFISVTGAAAPISGTRIGDCLGNSGITFDAPKTVYWVSSASANWSGAVWSTVSGNTGGTTTAFPLGQDTIVINNAGLVAAGTITVDAAWNIPILNFAARTNTVTLATGANNLNTYGDLTFSAATFTSGTGSLIFVKQNGATVITSAGRTFSQLFLIEALNGSLRLNGSLVTTNTFTLSFGQLDMTNNGASNFYSLTCNSFILSGASSRSIVSGFGGVTLTGTGTVWNGTDLTNFTLTGTLEATASTNTTNTRTFSHGSNGTGSAANAISARASAGSGGLDLTSGSHYFFFSLGNFSGSLFNRTLTIHAGWSINTSVSLNSGSLATTFASTSATVRFISTSGRLIPFPMIFNGVGGNWALQNTLNMPSYALTLTNGTLNTAGFAVTVTSVSSAGSGVRTLTLGASTVTLSGATPLAIASSFVLNAGTSTIICTGLSVSFTGFDKTFYNASFTNTGLRQVSIVGANTFNNVNFAAKIGDGLSTVFFVSGTTTTINGTLTLGSGTTGVNRLFVRVGTTGSPATLSVASLAAITDIDFRDITVTGAVAPISGTRLGNCLGNSGITFAAPRIVYWVSATSGNWSGASWSTTSGNTGGTTTAFPLAQDSIIIDNAGLAASGVITVNTSFNIPDLSFATRTNAVTFALGITSSFFYGNITLSSVLTQTGTGTQLLSGQSKAVTITSAGRTFSSSLQVDAPLGTVRIADNLTTTANLVLTRGTLDLTNNGAGNFTLTPAFFASDNSNTRSITFGTGKIVIATNNNLIWNAPNIAGFTYTGTPRVELTYTGATGSRRIQHGNAASGNEAGAVSFYVTAGSDGFGIEAESHIKDLEFSSPYQGIVVPNTGNRTFYGNLTLSTFLSLGVNAACITRFSSASATQTVSLLNKTLNFAVVCNGANNTVSFSGQLNPNAGFTFTSGTVILDSGFTNTFLTFVTTGTTLKFLRSSTSGSRAILSKSSGTVDVSYLSIKDTSATGGATWLASVSNGNIDAGNNIGWNFSALATVTGFLALLL